jgi:hypothetical protein
MSLTKVTYSMIRGAAVNVLDYGVLADGTTNNSVALAAALAAVPVNGTLYFPAGVYCGYLLIYRSDITIMGDGSASTILKLPNNCPTITVPHDGIPNPITGLPNVIEIGECALGNAANLYERINVIGLTLDGNYTNNTAPTTDLFGHGMILTKASHCFIDDVVAQNCHMTGIDNVINSNYNTIRATTIDCGNAPLIYPNFDINSSKYCNFDITSEGGAFSGRMLDNCWNNTFTLRGTNPLYTGLVYNNQSVNVSYANIINVTIVDGCTLGQGVSVGANCFNSQINATIQSAAGVGFFVNGGASTPASGNTFNINTYQCGSSGVSVLPNCKYNKFNIVSKEDCRTGPSGSNFAVDVDGADNNQFTVCIQEGTTSQARGFIFRAGADNNHIIDLLFDTNLVEVVNDLGTGNYINWPSGSPVSAIASANLINIPFAGSLFEISGNTGMVGATATNTYRGRVITLLFQSNPIVSQKTGGLGENFILSGSVNFNATAGDTLTLITDGTNWIEIARTVI